MRSWRETKRYEIDPFRFHAGQCPFPRRFLVLPGEQPLRFHAVSRSFPFVSRFHAYRCETGNERRVARRVALE